MLKGLRVPTHRIDAPGVLILAHDDAWDHDRIEAEQAECEVDAMRVLRKGALTKFASERGKRVDELTDEEREQSDASCSLTEAEKEEARSRHPWRRYQAGATRFQADAPDQGPRGPARAADYLRPDAVPTCFELRRIGWQERARIDLDQDRVSRWSRLVRAGVARVSEGEHVIWAARDRGDCLPDDLLDHLGDAEGSYATLIAVAAACMKHSQPLTESEGKR